MRALRLISLLPLVAATVCVSLQAQPADPRLFEAGTVSGFPLVVPNDNRTPAGTLVDGVLNLDLDIVWADFRVETDDGPGLRVAALSEAGGPPMVPAPLIRVTAGTTIRATIKNSLDDSTVTAFGLQRRPADERERLVVAPGESVSVEFEAGEPGTYLYMMKPGARFGSGTYERFLLSGAFIVDPAGGSPPDRVFVMNVWSNPTDTLLAPSGYLEALTINGKSWPFTERERPAVGDTLRWRVINANWRGHPMHLHGFYYDVLSRGGMLWDSVYAPEDRREVVTEDMSGRTTMMMQWVPTRPGNWLFHCHLSFHVSPDIRLPGVREDDAHHVHMAGLVVGIEVQPGESDLIRRGDPRNLTVYANEYPADSGYRYGFSLDPEFQPDDLNLPVPGPVLIMNQYDNVSVTVENRMSVPTSVHWHGLELDAWSDGVPGWSASDGRVSPVIPPGESFTYQLSLMRPGTFIYHSHLDDVHQLTGGLYGPLLVLAEGETYSPERDHFEIVGWRKPQLGSLSDAELNGRSEQLVQHAKAGETHRLRLINIAPAGKISARMTKGENAVPLQAVAKDGSELPENQRVFVDATPTIGVGATADFTFTPTEAGTYELLVDLRYLFLPPDSPTTWRQTWEVTEPDDRR